MIMRQGLFLVKRVAEMPGRRLGVIQESAAAPGAKAAARSAVRDVWTDN